jgi:hypothetical protein
LVKQKEQKGMEKKNSVQTQNEDPNFSRSVLHFLIFIFIDDFYFASQKGTTNLAGGCMVAR